MKSASPISLLLRTSVLAGLMLGVSAAAQAPQDDANAPQKADYRVCCSTLDTLRNRTDDTIHYVAATHIDMDAVRQNQAQVREQFRKVEENRTKLRGSLSADQQKASQAQMRQLDSLRDRIENHLKSIDDTLSAPTLDRERLTQEARLVERAMRAYRMHFHDMTADLGKLD